MHLSWIETLGFITGAVCVLPAVKENVWNWPIGILNNVAYLVVFWHSKLYADSGLQLFYIAISVYGLWCWLYGGEKHTQLAISRVTRTAAFVLFAASIASAGILYYVLRNFTDSNVPLGDAVTTAMSLTAQYMLGRKMIENWLLWIAADVLYIGLYCYKSLYLTALLYAIFIAMCVAGYLRWQRTMSGPVELTEAPEGIT